MLDEIPPNEVKPYTQRQRGDQWRKKKQDTK